MAGTSMLRVIFQCEDWIGWCELSLTSLPLIGVYGIEGRWKRVTWEQPLESGGVDWSEGLGAVVCGIVIGADL